MAATTKQEVTALNPKDTNISGYIEGGKLYLEIDLSRELGPSKSQRTTLIASSGPGIKINDKGFTLGLNLYRK